jgi:DNA-binding NarL/FixJ family response regulator
MTIRRANPERDTPSRTRLHRVLVVEDHAAFRRIVCELLQESPAVQIVGEAADGLEAVRQAEALQPDVVVLDISLPKLSGLEVASFIRAVVPTAKVLFITVELSLEVMEEALRRGAHGYVFKPRAQRDMLPVLDAILEGAQFVSGGLERVVQGDTLASHRHDVVFCTSDEAVIGTLGRFIASCLGDGSAVISLIDDSHVEGLHRHLQAAGVELDRAAREQRYVPLTITDLLASVMVNGYPDPMRFFNLAENLADDVARRAANRRVAACGECAPMLWAQGHREAAIQLEQLWDEVAKSRQMDILCVYPVAARTEQMRTLRRLCAVHTAVQIR